MDSPNRDSASNECVVAEQQKAAIPDSMKYVDHMTSSSSEKVMSLQRAMQNKKIILTGGCGSLTAETWEFERKVRLHKQLKLARRLRSVMERALEEAKAEIASKEGRDDDDDDNSSNKWIIMKQKKDAIREIFFKYSDDMLQLASLSNAVLSGFTMDSYDEYIDLHNEQKKKEKETFESSQRYLNGLRQRMLWENTPSTLFSDPKNKHLMQRRDQQPPLPSNDTTNLATGTTGPSVTSGNKTEKKKTAKPSKKSNKKTGNNTPGSKSDAHGKSFNFEFAVEHTETGHKKRSSPQSKQIKNTSTKVASAKRSSLESKKHKDGDVLARYTSNTNKDTPPKSTKKYMNTFSHQLVEKEPVASKLSRQTSSSSSTRYSNEKNKEESLKVTKSIKSHPVQKVVKRTKVKPKAKKPARKCHSCKESTTEHSLCGYWFANGNRCRKTFCGNCLAKYKMEISDRDDWHCPSCLGICKCAVCVKERERELVRATKRRRLRG